MPKKFKPTTTKKHQAPQYVPIEEDFRILENMFSLGEIFNDLKPASVGFDSISFAAY